MYKFCLAIVLLVSYQSIAQINVGYRIDSIITVTDGPNQFNNAFDGGFNSVTAFQVDLDFDGKLDFVLYDRGWRHFMPYLNKGATGQISYEFAPQYAKYFPKDGYDYVISADYNYDGRPDLFTFQNPGLSVYTNTSINGQLSFELKDSTYLKFGNNPSDVPAINILVAGESTPSLVDIDNDGDLDILALGGFGQMDLYENLDVDSNLPQGTMKLWLSDKCWGKFSKPQNKLVNLNVTCKGNAGNTQNPFRHGAGRSILHLDANGDGKLDLVLGEGVYNSLSLLINTGTSSKSAQISAQDTLFPANFLSTSAGELSGTPTSFYMDINNDGKKDLIVAPGDFGLSQAFDNLKLFVNFGTTAAPDFKLNTTKFLAGEILDFGYNSTAITMDVDGDGLKDILVGTEFYSDVTFTPGFDSSGISYLKNIGTATSPQFALIDRNWGGFTQYGFYRISPAVGDLDDDGDKDMLIGTADGQLYYFENNPVNGVATYSLTASNYFGIFENGSASPQLHDINGDTLLDIITGNAGGQISIYLNTGTKTQPNFPSIPDNGNWGQIQLSNPFAVNSKPFVGQLDSGGKDYLFVGGLDNKVFIYDSISSTSTSKFQLIDSIVTNVTNANMMSVDLDGDSIFELISGNVLGGFQIYSKRYNVELGNAFGVSPCNDTFQFDQDGNPIILKWCDSTIVILPCDTCDSCLNDTCVYAQGAGVLILPTKNTLLKVYPNPVTDQVIIESQSDEIAAIQVADVMGRIVYNERYLATTKTTIPMQQERKGIYHLTIKSSDGSTTHRRFVLQ